MLRESGRLLLLREICFGRNLGFAGDICLAQSTAVPLEAVLRSYILSGRGDEEMFTGDFIMTGLGNGPDRASLDTLPAQAFSMKEAVRIMILIRSACGGYGDVGYHRAATHRLALGGNETFAQAKGPQARCICCMPFRPRGGKTKLLGLSYLEEGREHGGDGIVT